MMEFGWAIYSGFSQYARFRGRERRLEYIYWILFVLIGAALCGILDAMVYIDPPFTLFYFLLILTPTFAVVARRLHDTNRSGWFALAILLPVVGYFVLFALMSQAGTPGPNWYGVGGSARQA